MPRHAHQPSCEARVLLHTPTSALSELLTQQKGRYCLPVVVDVAVLALVETGDGGTNAAREFPGGR